MSGKESKAKIFLYDIENTPSLGYVWGKYQQDVIQFAEEWHLLSFAYKWLGEKDVKVVALPDFKEAYKKDPTNDYEVVRRLHELFSEADILVAHNGNAFDQKKTNARFLVHGLEPPTPYKQIDTYLVTKKYFNFNSNKLGDLGQTLGLGGKKDTGGFSTWLGCMRGDQKSWDTMCKYNKQDVVLLEKIYLKLRPWIDGHPNVALLNGDVIACPKCGSHKLSRQGYKINKVATNQQWKCGDCGGWSSTRLSEKTARKPIIVN